MDEEEQKQSDSKISISSFFERVDSADKVANSALSKANANLGVINTHKSLLNSISVSIEALQTKVRDIANFIIIEKKLEKDAEEDRRFEQQDEAQKGSMLERLAGLKSNNESEQTQTAPGGEEPKKGGGILGALLSLGIGAFALKFLWPALLPLIGGLIKGGLAKAVGFTISGSGALLKGLITGTLGKVVGLGGIFTALATSIGNRFDKTANSAKNVIKGFSFKREGDVDGPDTLEVDSDGEGAPTAEEGGEKSKYDKLVEAGFEFEDKGIVGGERVIDYKGPDDGKETFFSKGLGGILGIGEGSKLTGRYKRIQSEGGTKTLLGEGSGDSLEDIINRDKSIQLPKGRSFGNRLLGGLDALTGNITDFDQEGGKVTGGSRVLGGIIDAATGNFLDIDKEGGETFGTSRVFGGILDALTGDKYNFDKKERKKKEKEEEEEGTKTVIDNGDTDLTDKFGLSSPYIGNPFGPEGGSTYGTDTFTVDSEISNKNMDLSLSETFSDKFLSINEQLDNLSEDFTGSISAEGGQMFSRPSNSPNTTVTVFKQTSSNSPFTNLTSNKYLSLNKMLPPEVYRAYK